ncbi:hypothetical protein [uncultured Chryseobacterium sp.]|uniref:hypothetical protein n=1 Tax=uncultured Chryseobacterium sp. TaxID=259322 RepID=UPI0025D47E91|nr:hypothetical protein [uncultured Chryseobacterium sp.]
MENTFKGTKGKWQLREYNNGSIDIAVGDYVFAEVYYNAYQNPGEIEANALLISKAPEMFWR